MATPVNTIPNVNFWRYSSAVFSVAQRGMWQMFDWLFKHENHEDPHKYIVICLHQKGKKIYGAKEKLALDQQDDPATMDIPLLYQLLMTTCGLAEETESFKWNKPQSQEQRDTLEHRLYLIKEARNSLSHDLPNFMHLTDDQLAAHMDNLRALLCSAVEAAGRHAAQTTAQVEAVTTSIKEDLTKLQLSMPPSAISPQQFALLAKRELLEQWEGSAMKEENLLLPQLKWAQGGQMVTLSQLLQGPGEEPPRVLVVLGETGIGKSSLCWQMYSAWLHTDDTVLPELAALDVVVMVECRRVNTRDLTWLLKTYLLPKTCQQCEASEVLQFLRELRVLWLVDGFEEASADARALLAQLSGQCSSGHVMLLTGQPNFREDIVSELSAAPAHCYITHSGLTKQGFHSLLSTLLHTQLHEPTHTQTNEENTNTTITPPLSSRFIEEVNRLDEQLLQELRNPLKLILTVQLWKEDRLRQAAKAPLTGLYAAFQEAQVSRLVTKLRGKSCSLSEAEAVDRVQRWVAALWETALGMWARGCQVQLDEAAEQSLKDSAVQLILPYTDCFSAFLMYRPGAAASKYSFLHHTQQSVMAAQHLHSLLLQDPQVEEVVAILLPGQPTTQRMDHFLAILVYLATSLTAQGCLTARRAQMLALLLEQCHACPWIDVLRLTDCCPTLAQEVRLRLPPHWRVHDLTLQVVDTLARINPPESITITVYQSPHSLPQLLPLLQYLANTTATICLALYASFDLRGPCELADYLLHPLCTPASRCHLLSFTGLLTAKGCKLLHQQKQNIKTLRVGLLEPSALQQVMSLTHQSESLEQIEFRVFGVFQALGCKTVPPRVQVCLSLMEVGPKQADEAAALARAINHQFKKITLGAVIPSTVCSLVRGFRKERIRTPSLGWFIDINFLDHSELSHVHFASLPLPTNLSLRTLYKEWRTPNITLNITVTQTVQRAPSPTHNEHQAMDYEAAAAAGDLED